MNDKTLYSAKMMSYDTSYFLTTDLCDNMPYVRTYELCNESTVGLFSGNVIKNGFYNIKKAYIINNHDTELVPVLNDIRLSSNVVNTQEADVTEEVTESY